MKILKGSLALVLVSSSLAGCGMREDDGDVADDFRNGIPRKETVELQVPGAARGQALTDGSAEIAFSVKGQTADLYNLTRAVSGIVNGGGAFTLALVKLIILHPPTQVSADSAVWGPWTGDALDPISWKLTVNRTAAHQYAYELAGRPRGDANAAFITVLSGTHKPALGLRGRPLEGFGEGTFKLDWNARKMLPAPDDNVGVAEYRYARANPAATVEVDAEFKQVKDRERPGQLVDVSYRYRSTPSAGGSMEFVHTAPATSPRAGARLAAKSRWIGSGAGRTDVRAVGGDLPAGVNATWNECWDSSFASAYQQMSWDPSKSYGVEATDCPFTGAEYSNL